MQLGGQMLPAPQDEQKQKPMGQARPMGLGSMGGGMFPGGMRQPPFYRGGGGMGLREALGGQMRTASQGLADRAQQRFGEAQGGPTPMGNPMRSPQPMPAQQAPPSPQMDSGFRPPPQGGVLSPPLVAPPSSVGEQQGGAMSPPIMAQGKPQSAPGPFYGYPDLASWQRATFGQQF
jgi:hypothetical protein